MNGRADRRGAVFALVAMVVAALLAVQLVAKVAPWFWEPVALAAARAPAESSPPGAVRPEQTLDGLLRPEVAALRDEPDDEPERRAPELPRCEDPRIGGWVVDLRDDDVRWNATEAVRQLCALPPGEIVELEQALGSSDLQQRYTAAGVLRIRCGRDLARPSAGLLQVSVDALSSRVDVDTRFLTGDSTDGSLYFLAEHTRAARQPLARALATGDAQQRFLCAYLLARERLPEADAWAVRQLVEHLGDNRIRGDALMATHGLYRLGEPAMAQMLEMRRYADEQGRGLLDLVLLDLRDPPRDVKALRSRRALHDISCIYHDPAIEYRLGRSPVPFFTGW
ncbi:MAG: hypothetical protein H6835_05635 [Planctomycetes bacterium]|nr:hypothetical protein [Planctomycetota bacterium]